MSNRHVSAELFELGRRYIPDGVSSPMRAFGLVGGHPICAASAGGSRIVDADGNVYVDFLNAFGAQFLGHAHEQVVLAVQRQMALGSVYGLSTELEYRAARTIVESTPAIDSLRFVCSGTEAVMTATRIARAHTGRNLLLKFRGSYHGHSDALLASPANIDAAASKKGVTRGIANQLNHDVLLCGYNDLAELTRLFEQHGKDIAAVLVEPIATNMGFVKPLPSFLETVRSLCTQHGALFIFDEVVTGFRFTFGGVCKSMNIDPDLVTWGKIIGGGLPIGAFGGKAKLMRHVAQGGTVFQSGTFAANPLTMAATNAVLDVLAQPGFYDAMERRGALLESELRARLHERRISYHVARHGALAGVAFRESRVPMSSYEDVRTQHYDVYKAVHGLMMREGFLMAPSLEEPIFLSAAHSDDDIRRFAAALARSIETARQVHAPAVVLA